MGYFSAGISQRDTNHYDFLNDPATQRKIVSSVADYWEKNVKAKWNGVNSCASSFISPARHSWLMIDVLKHYSVLTGTIK